jgi:hypothetical protein
MIDFELYSEIRETHLGYRPRPLVFHSTPFTHSTTYYILPTLRVPGYPFNSCAPSDAPSVIFVSLEEGKPFLAL